MVDSNNLLDPSLDISGSLTQKDDLVQSEEALKLGSRISGQSGSNASINHSASATTVSGLTGMTANSVGKYLTLSGASTSANNGNFLIKSVNSSTSVNINNPNAVSDANNGNISWVERNVYSLEDDLNYERTDRSEIKGVDYSAAVPTYYKVNDLTTPIKANLANIAGNTTDAKALITNRKFENATVIVGASYIAISGSVGSLPYAKSNNKLGLPILDGYDAGNLTGCYCEIINPSTGQELKVLTGIHAGERIFGYSREGSSGVDGQSFEVELRSVVVGEPISTSSIYSWEAGLPTTLDVFYPFRESLAGMSEGALRVTLVNGLFAEGGGGSGGDGYFGGISAGTQLASSGYVTFVNSNGISFGMSNSGLITASYTVPSTVGLISRVNISAGTTSNNLTNFVFSNSNNVTFGLNGSTITASVSQSSLSFSNQNGVSFGLNGSTLTASVSQTVQTQSNVQGISAGTTVARTGDVVFSNSNGLSFGLNGNTVTGSYSVPSTAGLISNINVSAGTTSNNLSGLTFSNSNGLSFGLNGSTITGSYTVPTQSNQTEGRYAIGNTTGQSSSSTFDARTMSISGAGNISVGYSGNALVISGTGGGGNGSVNVSAGTTSNNLTNFVLSNSNGLSFGLNGSTLTGSYTTLVFSNSNGISFGINNGTLTATVNPGAAAGIAAVQGGTQTATSGTVVFSNSNGITFGLSNSSVMTASYTVPSTAGLISAINVSGGTTSNNLSALTFSNANNVSFGLNGSTLTASIPNQTNFVLSNSNGISFGTNGSTVTATYTVPTQTNQSVGLYALGNTTQNSSTTLDARSLSFNGLGAATVGYSNGSIQVSVPVQTVQTQSNIQAIYDGANSISTGTIRYSNANGVSFGINGQTLTASVANQTNQTVGLYALGNTTQNSSTTLDARTLSFNGLGIITAGYSNGSIQISGSQSAQTQNVVVPSAGTQTATSGTVIFSNSNGISFGMSNSSVVTASYTVPSTAGLISNINVSAGTTSNNLSALTFSNSNGLAFGLNGSVVTGSYTVPTQTNQTQGLYAVGNTTGQSSSSTFDARTLSISGAGIASVGYSGGNVIISVPAAGALVNFSAGTTSGNINAVTFSNSNGVSFGLNNGVITATVTPGAAAGIGAVQGGTQTQTSGTLVFSNSNGISFGLSNSSVMTASYTVPTQTNQTQGLYAVGNTTGQSSSSTVDARSLSFQGTGNVSIGYSNGSIVVSGAGGNGSVNISAGTTSNNLTNFVFSNSNGLAFGLNGSTVTGSYTVPTQTNQTVGLYGLGNTTQNSSTTLDARSLSFNGLGAATVGYSNGSIQISVPVQTAQTQSNIQAIYDGANSISTGTIRYSNANGVSFGINGQTLTASVANQTNQTVGLYATGNTTQNSSTTLDARSLSFNGLGIITAGYSNGSIQISATQSAQTQNVVIPSAGTQTATSGTVVFSNSNGISFGMSNSSVITASYTVPSTAGLISNINVSAGTTSNNLSALTFSNSNGLAFGLNGSVVTGSYTVPTQTNQSIGLYGLGNTTQNSSTTLDARSLSFNGLGGNTVGYSNGSIQISGVTTAGLISGINVSAGTTSNNLTAVTFSNSNGLAFGLNGSVVTGSYTVPTQTNQSVGLYALGNTTQNSSTTLDARSLSFNGLGAATVGYSNGSIQVSVPVQTVQTQNNIQAIYDGVNSISTGTIRFTNANGVSFSINGQTISGSVAAQTNQTVGIYGIGNTTGQSSSSTFDARSLSFSGAGIVSVGNSNGSIIISAVAAGAGDGGNILAAGTQTAISNASVVFSNSNGISFGMSNSSVITASYTVPSMAGLISAINISAGTTSNNLSAVTFSNSNGLAFGLNGSVVTGSYTVPTQTNQSVGLYALGNTTQNSSTTLDARSLSFNGLGAATVGYSNGSIQISVPVQSAYVFSNSNNISFGTNGSTVTATATFAQTNQTVGLYGLGNTTQNSSTTLDARSLSFNGLGIVTVGYSNGSVQISATQSNQTEGRYAIGNTTGQSSSSTFDARTMSISGAGIASVGYSGNALVISVPSGGGGITNINVSAGTTSNNLSNIVFSNSNGVSFGLNGSTVTASVAGPGAATLSLFALGNTTQNSSTSLDGRSLSFNGLGAMTMGYSNGSIQVSAPAASSLSATGNVSISTNGSTISIGVPIYKASQLVWPPNPWQTNFQISNASFSLQRFNPSLNITATQANFLMALSGNTNSSGALTVSFGIYTMNGSTMSLASSNSQQISWTSGSQTTTGSIYGGVSGTRYRTVALGNWNITGGDYVLGMWFRTTNDGTWRAFGQQGPTIVGALNAAETNNYGNGFSTSSYTTAMIGSVNVTDTNYVRTGDNALQQPSVIFLGTF